MISSRIWTELWARAVNHDSSQLETPIELTRMVPHLQLPSLQ